MLVAVAVSKSSAAAAAAEDVQARDGRFGATWTDRSQATVAATTERAASSESSLVVSSVSCGVVRQGSAACRVLLAWAKSAAVCAFACVMGGRGNGGPEPLGAADGAVGGRSGGAGGDGAIAADGVPVDACRVRST